MKARTLLLTLALYFVGIGVCFAQQHPSFMGTWKLNESKSKLAPGAPKNNTVVYEAAGDSVKVTIDGTDAAGSPTHTEWTGKFDGKDYPVEGGGVAQGTTSSARRLDERTLEVIDKVNGDVTRTERRELSPDLKTLTRTVHPVGQLEPNIFVYERQ